MGLSLSIAAHIAGSGTHGWKASGPRNLARLIRDARRHSARVRLMRTAVPAAAVAGLGAVVLLTWFNPLRALPELPISAANLVVSGTKITMEAPKLTGFTRDNRAYNVTAEAAAQDFTNPSVLELTGIHNTKSELLTLTQHIILISSDGYEGHLTEATADVRKGSIVSEKPVEMFLPNGKLNANRMEVENNGELLRFDGGVVLNLNSVDSAPSDKSTAADKSAPADKKGTRR
jgi:lipopolysaccharide export system protein LptC